MRWTFLVLILCCLPQAILGASKDFTKKSFAAPLTADPNNKDTISITYYIKEPKTYVKNTPVFYGIASRGSSAKDMADRYDFFESVYNEFDKALVIFVDQRFYGESPPSSPITSIETLTNQLTMDILMNDHVTLMKELITKTKINTLNFMAFGVGYGGVVASFLSNYLSTKTTIIPNIKIMAWSSSSPIKYLAHQKVPDAQLNDIGIQFFALLQQVDDPECKTNVQIAHFNNFFTTIKTLKKTVANSDVIGLFLSPALTIQETAADGAVGSATPEQKELALFLRNKMINLLINDSPYDTSDRNNYKKRTQTKLIGLCKSVKAFTTAFTDPAVAIGPINEVLKVFDAKDNTPSGALSWQLAKPKGDGTFAIDKDLLLEYYQDCTLFRLAACGGDSTKDPFSVAQWDVKQCTGENFDDIFKTQCTDLFTNVPGKEKFKYKGLMNDPTDYPTKIPKNQITSINKQSLFGANFNGRYKDIDDKGSYATFFSVSNMDGWEFQAPHDCDSDNTKKARYFALRAFACFSSIVSNRGEACPDDSTKLFKDSPTDVDPDSGAPKSECKITADKFPYSQKPGLTFGSTATTTTTSLPITTSTPSTTTKGGNGFVPSAMIILASALLAWFVTV